MNFICNFSLPVYHTVLGSGTHRCLFRVFVLAKELLLGLLQDPCPITPLDDQLLVSFLWISMTSMTWPHLTALCRCHRLYRWYRRYQWRTHMSMALMCDGISDVMQDDEASIEPSQSSIRRGGASCFAQHGASAHRSEGQKGARKGYWRILCSNCRHM